MAAAGPSADAAATFGDGKYRSVCSTDSYHLDKERGTQISNSYKQICGHETNPNGCFFNPDDCHLNPGTKTPLSEEELYKKIIKIP